MKTSFFVIALILISPSGLSQTAESIRLQSQLNSINWRLNQMNWASQQYFDQQKWQQNGAAIGNIIAAVRESGRQKKMVQWIIEACLEPNGSPKINLEEFGVLLRKLANFDPQTTERLLSTMSKSYSRNRKWLNKSWPKILAEEDRVGALIRFCNARIKKEKDRLDKFTVIDICLAQVSQ